MISIWLDDERNPQDKKIQTMFGATGVEIWVKSADECIALIKQHDGNIARISLDHDLGPFEFEGKNGYTVAKFIEQAAFRGELQEIPRMFCHSQSPSGKRNILLAFRKAECFWEIHNDDKSDTVVQPN